jgi:hypothetical protein
MEKNKLFDKILSYKDEDDKDDLGIMINYNMNRIVYGEGAVGIKKWPSLIEGILRWYERKLYEFFKAVKENEREYKNSGKKMQYWNEE